ncbi:MAG: SpoIID/LytB domain-containing protein [Ignavibacteria bacterium]|nr:SpoIID/LytB domain-containing protein [Ignavibacteria bacterium]
MKQPIIKVGIIQNQDSITFNIFGEFILNNKLKIKDRKLTAIPNGKKIFLKENDTIIYSDETLNFVPVKNNYNIEDAKYRFEIENVMIGIDFHWEQKERESFEGNFLIINKNNMLTLINEIEVERYLQSVIASEMNSESPFEYLKAHSIVSRSWLLAQLENRKKNYLKEQKFQITDTEKIIWHDKTEHEDFDVCADDHCQRYQGLTRLKGNAALLAVRETFGMVLTYNQKICDTRYSKCCGGITEEFQNVWQDTYYPYLKSIRDSRNSNEKKPESENEFENFIKSNPDAYCNTTDENLLKKVLNEFDLITKDFYRWKIEIKQLALKTLFEIKLGIDFGEIKELIPLERGKSGRIKKLKIVGTKKEFTIGKELEIRRALSEKHLYSSAFVIEPVFKEGSDIPCKFILHGAGWGHGVGFCQIGGAVMASEGKKFDEILKHYFPDADLVKIY